MKSLFNKPMNDLTLGEGLTVTGLITAVSVAAVGAVIGLSYVKEKIEERRNRKSEKDN